MTEDTSEDEERDYTQRVDMKIYDIPVELQNKYISMAKLDYDNQMWKVLEAGMDALMEERQRKVPELEQRVNELQKQIGYLKMKIEELESTDLNEEREGPPKTFGDQPDADDDEILDRFSK